MMGGTVLSQSEVRASQGAGTPGGPSTVRDQTYRRRARVAHALYAWIRDLSKRITCGWRGGEWVMDVPRTLTLSTDPTLQTDANSVLESTPQKRRFPLTRRASTRSTASSVVRREMHVPGDNASGTWQLSLIVF